MNVLFASSEVVPFAKTGGLADVCGALPIELARQGHTVQVIMPAYRQVFLSNQPIRETGIRFDIPVGSKIVAGKLLESQLPGSDVPVYLVHQPDYFDRPQLYREQGQDYPDNCERYIFFCRATLEAIRSLRLNLDAIHCHDWQTGLIPAYLRIEYRHARMYEQIASVFTIHNLAYQGMFWHWDMPLTGLDWKYFNYHQMEFHNHVNLLKTGLVFSDALTTVSPTYAEEIQTAELGCGLEQVLRLRKDVLSGIVNGIDAQIWNPATDESLPARFDASNWRIGKAACKRALQAEFGLATNATTPVIGLVGRLADQKGWDLIARVIEQWAPTEDVQWVILGTGEPHYHELLTRLVHQFPQRVAARLDFNDPLAHRIEAGSDLFLMPSRYEPCGLNQLYSLRYGTVPVVRRTGGLADTVTDTTDETIVSGQATGFAFSDCDVGQLEQTLRRACDLYRQKPAVWEQLVTTGMNQDWSWSRSARQYSELYQHTVHRRRSL